MKFNVNINPNEEKFTLGVLYILGMIYSLEILWYNLLH